MRVYLYTIDPKNNVTADQIELYSVCDSLYDNLSHSIFSLVLIGAYIYKILTKQSSQFKSFFSFHILMHVSTFSLFIVILHSKYHLGIFFNLFIGVIALENFLIHAFNCLNLSITIFDFGPTVNTKKLRIILMVIGFGLRIALGGVRLVFEISEKRKIHTLFFENAICVLNLVLVSIMVIRKNKLDQNKFDVIIHSLISSASFLIFELFDGAVLSKLSKAYYNYDIFVFSSYYFVFLWVISVYITHSKAMEKYIDRGSVENPYVEMGKLDDSAKEKF